MILSVNYFVNKYVKKKKQQRNKSILVNQLIESINWLIY